ncbi:unnamed protein product [Parajaminaea phylloscopi]
MSPARTYLHATPTAASAQGPVRGAASPIPSPPRNWTNTTSHPHQGLKDGNADRRLRSGPQSSAIRGRSRRRGLEQPAFKQRADPDAADVVDDVARDLDHFAFDSDDEDDDDDDDDEVFRPDDDDDDAANGHHDASSQWLKSQGSHVRDVRITVAAQDTLKTPGTTAVSAGTHNKSIQVHSPSASPLLLAAPLLPFHRGPGGSLDMGPLDSAAPAQTSYKRTQRISYPDASSVLDSSRRRATRQSSPSWSLRFSRTPSTTSGSPILQYSTSPASQIHIHNLNSVALRRKSSDRVPQSLVNAIVPRDSSRATGSRASFDSVASAPGRCHSSTSVASGSSSRPGTGGSADWSASSAASSAHSSTTSLPWLPLLTRRQSAFDAINDDEHAMELLEDDQHGGALGLALNHASSSPRSLATVFKDNATGQTACGQGPASSEMGRTRSKSDTRAVLQSLTTLRVARHRA